MRHVFLIIIYCSIYSIQSTLSSDRYNLSELGDYARGYVIHWLLFFTIAIWYIPVMLVINKLRINNYIFEVVVFVLTPLIVHYIYFGRFNLIEFVWLSILCSLCSIILYNIIVKIIIRI
jgi:hypothetical protein